MSPFDNDATDAACTELLDLLLTDERAWMDELIVGAAAEEVYRRVGRSPEMDFSAGFDLDAYIKRVTDAAEAAEADQSPLSPGEKREAWFRFLGNVLWDTFSENNDVIGPEGKRYHLGSWRGTGGFLADYLNAVLAAEGSLDDGEVSGGPFTYIDFYMGNGGFRESEDEGRNALIRTLYLRIFERLKARGFDWRYSPPSTGLVSFPQPEPEEDPATYNPNAALAEAAEREEKAASLKALRADLEKSNAKAFEEAERNPPVIVRAYEEVYGRRPRYERG